MKCTLTSICVGRVERHLKVYEKSTEAAEASSAECALTAIIWHIPDVDMFCGYVP